MIRRSAAFLAVLVLALTPAVGATTKKKSTTSSTTSKKSSGSVSTSTKSPGIAEPFAADADGRAPVVQAKSYIVLDARTGKVLHERNADVPRPVASTQKLLTGLIIAEDGGLDERVTVKSSDTWAEPTKLYMKPGEAYQRYKLLQILLIKSMNDVARCLARDNAGSVEMFAAKMNAKARSLGMSNSNFINPNGLPASGQYSTARDMAKVALAAYRNPVIRGIVKMKTIQWQKPSGGVTTYSNTNQVLKNWALCNGMKTGYTEASGFCLISSASYGGRDVIAIVLGCGRGIQWSDSYKLLNWALSS